MTDAKVLSALRKQIRLAGYSADFPDAKLRGKLKLEGKEGQTAGVHVGCSIDNVDGGEIRHSCDSMGGASGSALIALFNDGKYYIVSLHNAWKPLDPSKVPSNWRERCEGFRDGQRVRESACRNLGVQVSRWASQAAAMRKTQ